MRGFSRNHLLARGASFVGAASVNGRLLSLGRYPGIVEGDDRVRGELYQVHNPEVLTAVDDEEGYNFDRRLTDVTRSNRQRARAWVYWYRGPRTRGTPIPEGDWRTRWR
jgi:gamma-glutamylcyclotransferase (GGCT)/AIG2-like uncharacterized protein YtfP